MLKQKESILCLTGCCCRSLRICIYAALEACVYMFPNRDLFPCPWFTETMFESFLHSPLSGTPTIVTSENTPGIPAIPPCVCPDSTRQFLSGITVKQTKNNQQRNVCLMLLHLKEVGSCRRTILSAASSRNSILLNTSFMMPSVLSL